MFGTTAVSGRNTAVAIPEGQYVQGAATPGSVLNFTEAKTYAVQYADADGRVHTTLMHRINGVWYMAPNGENYASTLRPLSVDARLSKNLEERFVTETTTATIPKEDAVDVLAGS